MRYEDWDILLFPQDCKTPVKEFKTACHVVHDPEFSHNQGSFGLPTVCCFVPSLDAGIPFQISIHCWDTPTISQFTRSYTKYADAVKFEARLFIDGRLVASTCFDRKSTWPHVIANSFEFSKNGDLEPLRFPIFRQELLQQSYWSPADDFGRIKIVISEGFPRDSLTMPIERVKNIVAFSFQHAPLDILESSAIAWPNASMWQRTPYTASMPVPAYASEEPESHAHSPRRRSGFPPYMQGVMTTNSPSTHTKQLMQPSFNNFGYSGIDEQFGNANSTSYLDWLSKEVEMEDVSRLSFKNATERQTRKSNTDTSMPDYPPQASGQASARPDQQFSMATFQAQPEDDSFLGHTKVPTNTPTARGSVAYSSDGKDMSFASLFQQNPSSIPPDLANSLTNSLLNQPMPSLSHHHSSFYPHAPEVKSRKEVRLSQDANASQPAPASTAPGLENQDMRKVSQQMYIPSGASMPIGTVPMQSNSPFGQSRKASEVSQRVFSTEFGPNTNQSSADALRTISGNSAAQAAAQAAQGSAKRIRNFTPASAKVIDDEDEPQRASPQICMSPFAPDEKSD